MPNDFPELIPGFNDFPEITPGLNDFPELEPDFDDCIRDIKETAAEYTFISIGDAAKNPVETAHAVHRIFSLCESPIEIDLGGQLIRFLPEQYELIAQYRFSRFRYDFAIIRRDSKRALVLVECDGAAFHSSPEQIANDLKKDEAARAGGITIVRFTGREIVRDAQRCAEIIIKALP